MEQTQRKKDSLGEVKWLMSIIDELPNLELPLSLQLFGHVQDEQTITIPYFP